MSYKLKHTDQTIKINKHVIKDIEQTIGKYKVETGGILLAKNGIIEEFVFDTGGTCSHGAYDPDYTGLNKILKIKEAEGFEYVGSIHSHPRGVRYPSGDWGNNIGDYGAIKANLDCNPNLDKFICLIAYSTYDGGTFEIFPFIVFRNDAGVLYEAYLNLVGTYIKHASDAPFSLYNKIEKLKEFITHILNKGKLIVKEICE